MSAPVLLVFGLVAPPEASIALEQSLARLENETVQALAARGFDVRPAPAGTPRPSAEIGARAGDLAARYGVSRVVRLDLEPGPAPKIWITHHRRGVTGIAEVREVPCAHRSTGLDCPELGREVVDGLRARTRLDVDLAAALRERARAVTRCVRQRGRGGVEAIEIALRVEVTGRAQVLGLDPEPIRAAPLGRCLRAVFEGIDVGPFEGPPLEIRVPIDL